MIALAIALQIANADPAVAQAAIDKAVVSYFQSNLKDPRSAIVRRTSTAKERSMRVPGASIFNRATSITGVFACYSVNAKNSYGGYTGEQPYVAKETADGAIVSQASRYDPYRHSDVQDDDMMAVCDQDIPVTLMEPNVTATDASASALRLVADGRCEEAKSAALSANDAPTLLQVERLCRTPSPGR